MNFEQSIILKIKREFSGKEKYRLFLQYLDNIEQQIASERRLNTSLMSQVNKLKQKNENNTKIIQELKDELFLINGDAPNVKFVKKKTYDKLRVSKQMWQKLFWELKAELDKISKMPPSGEDH